MNRGQVINSRQQSPKRQPVAKLENPPQIIPVGNENLIYGPGSKVHGAKMGPIWGRQDPGGPNVGPMNFAIWGRFDDSKFNPLF